MKSSILVVEDSSTMQLYLRSFLEKDFEVSSAESAQEAYLSLAKSCPSLILLDVGLPDESGFEFCKKIRQMKSYRKVPIIFLTALDDTDSKVKGFALGAEDYVTKSVDPKELLARIMARLPTSDDGDSVVTKKGPLRIALDEQRVYLDSGGANEAFQLTSIEFKVLYFLIANEPQVVTREQLLEKVWGRNTHVTERAVDTCIYSIRKKMGKYGSMIRSIPKVGYGFVIFF